MRGFLVLIGLIALGVVVLMCVACIAFGTALNRVAFERT